MRPWAVWLATHKMGWVLYLVFLVTLPAFALANLLLHAPEVYHATVHDFKQIGREIKRIRSRKGTQ